MPPSFADQTYWEKRFLQQNRTFDWLLSAPAVCDLVADEIKGLPKDQLQLLHIGCGNSDLSFHLRKLVKDAQQVHNIDFSQAAIDSQIAKDGSVSVISDRPSSDRMQWSWVDLLSLSDVLDLSKKACRDLSFSTVIDKSTSDSIACGDDLEIMLPYSFQIMGSSAMSTNSRKAHIHPLHILAIHLAALTVPGSGRWIVVSYTDDRFPFFPPYPRSSTDGLLSQDTVDSGFPDPARLWRLEKKWSVQVPNRSSRAESGHPVDVVHRPEVSHWIYTLARTDAEITVLD